MNIFSEYLTSIFTAGICAFICESACTGFGSSKKLNKTLGTVTSLIMIIIIVLPIGKAIKNRPTFIDNYQYELSKDSENQDLICLTLSQLETEIEEKIYEETGIKPESIIINFNESDDAQPLKKITVVLLKKSTCDTGKVYNLVKEITGDKIIVEITEIHQ